MFEGGLYIGPNQRLAVTWSGNLSYRRASPTPDDRSGDTVTWTAGNGGRQFYDNEPRVVLRSAAPPSKETVTETQNENTSEQPWIIAGVLLLFIIGAVIAYRTDAIKTYLGDRVEPGSESKSKSESGTVEPSNNTQAAPTITEAELMTDEDRVLSLLQDNDGRMKQVNIVNETGWSKSKVSMLLSDMDEDGLISKLRVGRENIISIVGDEPEAARSPFEDKK